MGSLADFAGEVGRALACIPAIWDILDDEKDVPAGLVGLAGFDGGSGDDMETRTFVIGEGPYEIEVTMVDTGRGVTVTAGSTAPGAAHVGATAQAIPRPEEGRTATVSILAVPCHRDEVPAHDMAAIIATELRVPTTVTCGIHVDHAGKDDIARLVEVSHEAAHAVVERVHAIRRARWDDDDRVLAVTADGEAVGPVERIAAHTGEGILHQAFSIILVDDGDVVLCRRHPNKRLWGGVLADTCAGHPRVGEAVADGAARRLVEEIGAGTSLERLGDIVYREDHGDGRCECELCSVFAGRRPAGMRINEEEISEVRRVSLGELDGYLAGRPEQLAPWLREALLDEGIRSRLEEFARR